MPDLLIQEYRATFAGRPPSEKTVLRWIKAGKIAGRKLGGRWYVDPDRPPAQDSSLAEDEMAQKRLAKNRRCPPNVHPIKKKNVVYYRYRVPREYQVDKREIPLGTDERAAFDAADQLNRRYGVGARLVARAIAQIEGLDRRFDRFLDRFEADILPGIRVKGAPLSRRTLQAYRQIIARYRDLWGHLTFEQIEQGQVAAALRELTGEAATTHRSKLGVIWRYAVSEGLTRDNLPLAIIPPAKGPTKRHRLTLEAYQAIYAEASQPIRMAMELALNALQRRGDIQAMRFDDVRDDHLHVIVSKTEKHGKQSYLRIPVSLPTVHSEAGARTLRELIACCRDDIASAYLVHHKPRRRTRSTEKADFTQLSPKQISDGFAMAREAAGVLEQLPKEQRPSLHECIALGQRLRLDAGYSLEWIQALRGHASIDTTKLYLEGHQEWTTVQV